MFGCFFLQIIAEDNPFVLGIRDTETIHVSDLLLNYMPTNPHTSELWEDVAKLLLGWQKVAKIVVIVTTFTLL